MTAKEYLNQARFLDMRITSKTEQISALRDLAFKCTGNISDVIKNTNSVGSRVENAVTKIVDLENEINFDVDRLVRLKQEIMKIIKSIENIEYQIILEKRYLCGQSWDMIADDMHYSKQRAFVVHGKALQKIDNILKSRVKLIEVD